MPIEGTINSLYLDYEQTKPLFPRTKTKAISDDSGVGLDATLSKIQNDLSNKATESFVTNKIAEAQLGGGSGEGNIDLSGFATKDQIIALDNAIKAIDYPVDSVNGKTGAVQLNATDVGALPNTGGTVNGAVTIKGGLSKNTLDDAGGASVAGTAVGAYLEAFKEGNYDIRRHLCIVNPETDPNVNTSLIINETLDGTNWSGAYVMHSKNFSQYAAPAGHGLGEDAAFKGSWNSHVTTGFVTGYDPMPTGIDGYMFQGFSISYDGWIWQVAFKTADSETFASAANTILVRKRNQNGEWGEWEYFNPPMAHGVEYRTTKRHKGKPVYALLLPGGTLAGKSTFSINLSDRNIAEFVDGRYAIGNSIPTVHDIPGWGITTDMWCKFHSNAIYGYSNMEDACSDAQFYIEYTKTTDEEAVV